MKTTISKHLSLFLAATLAATTFACASDTGGDDDDDNNPAEGAYLSIVGDRDVFLENGWTTRLTVRYTGVTNSDGVVQVDLVAGPSGDALFTVEASAPYAEPVVWQVAVSEGAPPLPPLDSTGRYSVGSKFDIVSGLPGTAGDIINGFVEMTDDPYDPATFVLDLIVDKVDSGFIASSASSRRSTSRSSAASRVTSWARPTSSPASSSRSTAWTTAGAWPSCRWRTSWSRTFRSAWRTRPRCTSASTASRSPTVRS